MPPAFLGGHLVAGRRAPRRRPWRRDKQGRRRLLASSSSVARCSPSRISRRCWTVSYEVSRYGREERGRLTAVAEQQELAPFAGLVGLLGIGRGGSAWYSDGGQHGGGRVAAALECRAPWRRPAPPQTRHPVMRVLRGVQLCGPAAAAQRRSRHGRRFVVCSARKSPPHDAQSTASLESSLPWRLLVEGLVVLVGNVGPCSRSSQCGAPPAAAGQRSARPASAWTVPDRYSAPHRLQAPNSKATAAHVGAPLVPWRA